MKCRQTNLSASPDEKFLKKDAGRGTTTRRPAEVCEADAKEDRKAGNDGRSVGSEGSLA